MHSRNEIDLLVEAESGPKWIPKLFSGHRKWKIYSGRWKFQSPKSIVCLGHSTISTGENISLVGSNKWSDYRLRVKFVILSSSLRPPEGGVIFYYHFRNFRNYYSLHLCHAKNKIELIKRKRGRWSTIAERDYDFEKNLEYEMVAGSNAGMHQCEINGETCYEVNDREIFRGRIGIGSKFCACSFNQIIAEM